MRDSFRMKQREPDFSDLDSRAKTEAAVSSGKLVPMLLLPEEFGGTPGASNVVFVPGWVANQKRQIDLGTILPLVKAGQVTRYEAVPGYRGNSFVPAVVRVHAYEPGESTATINVW